MKHFVYVSSQHTTSGFKTKEKYCLQVLVLTMTFQQKEQNSFKNQLFFRMELSSNFPKKSVMAKSFLKNLYNFFNEIKIVSTFLQDMLKCVSCHRFLFPPILQCLSGHMECKNCFELKPQCGKCHQVSFSRHFCYYLSII
jgi:hypothetical protein